LRRARRGRALHEITKLRDRIDDRLRNAVLIGARCEDLFLFGIRQVADLDEHGRHVRTDQHAEGRLLYRARRHLHARTQRLLDEGGEGAGLFEIAGLGCFPENQVDRSCAAAERW